MYLASALNSVWFQGGAPENVKLRGNESWNFCALSSASDLITSRVTGPGGRARSFPALVLNACAGSAASTSPASARRNVNRVVRIDPPPNPNQRKRPGDVASNGRGR